MHGNAAMGAPFDDRPTRASEEGGADRASPRRPGNIRSVGVALHLVAALLLVAMAVSHGLGTGDAADRIAASGLGPGLARALIVLWVNGSVLPLVLAVVLLVATLGARRQRTLVGLVAGVLLLQAAGAAYVAGPGFFGVWVLVLAAALVAAGAVAPGRGPGAARPAPRAGGSGGVRPSPSVLTLR